MSAVASLKESCQDGSAVPLPTRSMVDEVVCSTSSISYVHCSSVYILSIALIDNCKGCYHQLRAQELLVRMKRPTFSGFPLIAPAVAAAHPHLRSSVRSQEERSHRVVRVRASDMETRMSSKVDRTTAR